MMDSKLAGRYPDFVFNKNWKDEGLHCPYEHCIELMPLEEVERRGLNACKIFGHNCPGGATQVRQCVGDKNMTVLSHKRIVNPDSLQRGRLFEVDHG